MASRPAQARDDAQWVLRKIDMFKSEQSQIRQDARYSDEYRAELLNESRQRAVLTVRDVAEVAWNRVRAGREAIEKERAAAYQAVPALDFGRLNFLVTDYKARLAQRPGGAMFGQTRAQQIGALREDALRRQDAHALRALRTVATEVLAGELEKPDHGERGALLALRDQFAADEAAETPARVRELEAEEAELNRAADELRRAIRMAAFDVAGENLFMKLGMATDLEMAVCAEDVPAEQLGGVWVRGKRVGPAATGFLKS